MNAEADQPLIVPEVDLLLLSEARRLLEGAGFTVAEANLQMIDVPWLLAENGLFALGIVAGTSLDDLIVLEAHAFSALTDRMAIAGAKRWDFYLVMLAREDFEERGSREVRRMQYDTNMLRRVVNLGVNSDSESVRRALRPFFPLPSPSQQFLGSVWGDLVDELVLQGIEPALAQSIIEQQQATWVQP
jgi:hypothetical protein